MNTHILAIDQGTTSSRAILFRDDCTVAAMAQQEFPQHYPASGWVEHEPEDLWQSVLATCHAAITEASVAVRDIAAIGIANQRETVLIWDRASGRPIHRAIVWQDRRTAEMCRALKDKGYEALVAKRTGLLLDPYFSASKIAWLLDHVPGARAKAEAGALAFGTVDTWVLWRLTGGAVHATDATNASRTALYDIHTNDWSDALCALFRVPRAILPEVRDCAAEYGATAPALFGAPIPIRGIAGDQQAALVGQACFAAGMMKATYGTGTFAILNTGTTVVASGNRLLSTIAYRLGGETVYGLEGAIFIAGAAVQWLRDRLGIVSSSEAIGAMAALADPAQDVVLVPAFVGLGAPHWDAEARGALFGLTLATGPNELARAVLESVVLPDARSPRRDALRLRRCARRRAARRRRHGGVRLDHAAARRHSRRPGRSPGDPGNDGARRCLSRRAAVRPLSGAETFRRALGARPAFHRRHGRRDTCAQDRAVARCSRAHTERASGTQIDRKALTEPPAAR